jgi:hypothetical protein
MHQGLYSSTMRIAACVFCGASVFISLEGSLGFSVAPTAPAPRRNDQLSFSKRQHQYVAPLFLKNVATAPSAWTIPTFFGNSNNNNMPRGAPLTPWSASAPAWTKMQVAAPFSQDVLEETPHREILAKDFRVTGILLAMGAGLQALGPLFQALGTLLQEVIGPFLASVGFPILVLAALLAMRTFKLELETDEESFGIADSYAVRRENPMAGGASRWEYKNIVNYEFFPKGWIDQPQGPLLAYFKEQQTSTDQWDAGLNSIANSEEALANGAVPGQVHWMPCLFDARTLRDKFVEQSVPHVMETVDPLTLAQAKVARWLEDRMTIVQEALSNAFVAKPNDETISPVIMRENSLDNKNDAIAEEKILSASLQVDQMNVPEVPNALHSATTDGLRELTSMNFADEMNQSLGGNHHELHEKVEEVKVLKEVPSNFQRTFGHLWNEVGPLEVVKEEMLKPFQRPSGDRRRKKMPQSLEAATFSSAQAIKKKESFTHSEEEEDDAEELPSIVQFDKRRNVVELDDTDMLSTYRVPQSRRVKTISSPGIEVGTLHILDYPKEGSCGEMQVPKAITFLAKTFGGAFQDGPCSLDGYILDQGTAMGTKKQDKEKTYKVFGKTPIVQETRYEMPSPPQPWRAKSVPVVAVPQSLGVPQKRGAASSPAPRSIVDTTILHIMDYPKQGSCGEMKVPKSVAFLAKAFGGGFKEGECALEGYTFEEESLPGTKKWDLNKTYTIYGKTPVDDDVSHDRPSAPVKNHGRVRKWAGSMLALVHRPLSRPITRIFLSLDPFSHHA